MLDLILGNRFFVTFLISIGIGLLSFLPIKLNLIFLRKMNGIKIQAVIWLWIIPIRINMVNPVTSLFWDLSVRKPWRKKPPPDIAAHDIQWLSFIKRTLRVTKVGQRVWHRANMIFARVKEQISIKELAVTAEIGWSDAACTALIVGIFWSMLGCVYSSLTSQFNMLYSKNKFAIVPDFQNERLCNIDASCIFEFRLGHIIIIIYQILRNAKDIYYIVRRASV